MFVEPEEEARPTPPSPPVKKDIEPPVSEIKAASKPVTTAPREEEKKGFFGGLFKKGKKEEEAPAPKPAKPAIQEKQVQPSVQPRAPVTTIPQVTQKPVVREEHPPAPVIHDKGKELARMVAEMKPLLSLAREKDVEIGESKQLIDQAAVAGRERQLDRAIELVQKSKNLLMGAIESQLAKEIAKMNER